MYRVWNQFLMRFQLLLAWAPRAIATVWAALWLALSGQAVHAHTIDASHALFYFPPDGSLVSVRIDTNLEAILADVDLSLSNVNDSPNAAEYDRLRQLPPEALRQEFAAFREEFYAAIRIEIDGIPLAFQVTEEEFEEVGDLEEARTTAFKFFGELPEGAQTFSFGWDARLGDVMLRTTGARTRLTHIERLENGAQSELLSLDDVRARSRWQMVHEFLVIGFEHIVPKGLDHILFVVGIFLLSTRLRPLVTQISAFTVAHTVTLALGALGYVHIAPSIVEPLIALSIAYVAVENIFMTRLSPWRPALVFAFGLLHGLGFAGILTEFNLKAGDFLIGLLSFNVGVELGQLAVIGICLALVGWFSGKSWYRRFVVIPGSVMIAVIGGFWFVERTFA